MCRLCVMRNCDSNISPLQPQVCYKHKYTCKFFLRYHQGCVWTYWMCLTCCLNCYICHTNQAKPQISICRILFSVFLPGSTSWETQHIFPRSTCSLHTLGFIEWTSGITFSTFLSQLRIHVEMAFGQLTTRWRILWSPLDVNLMTASKVIECCARIQNVHITEDTEDTFVALEICIIDSLPNMDKLGRGPTFQSMLKQKT